MNEPFATKCHEIAHRNDGTRLTACELLESRRLKILRVRVLRHQSESNRDLSVSWPAQYASKFDHALAGWSLSCVSKLLSFYISGAGLGLMFSARDQISDPSLRCQHQQNFCDSESREPEVTFRVLEPEDWDTSDKVAEPQDRRWFTR